MEHLNVQLAGHVTDYDIKIKAGLLDRLGQEIQEVYQGKRIFILTDENVDHYYGKKVMDQLTERDFQVYKMVVPAGEASKHIDHLNAIYAEMIDFKLSRGDLMIALGGGVIGDLAGYVAASFLRGIPFVQIPTTLLAQVDSSVGGKVAVDLTQGKNLVGAFYHPKKVIIDPNVLETLTDRAFSDGMAEVIKYGAIFDRDLFDFIKVNASREAMMAHIDQIIYRSCELKAIVVREDELDTGQRMLLNFGHTLGHAIEAYYQYKAYTHGQGVAIGMVTITQLAEDKGISPKGTAEEIAHLCQQFDLPIEISKPNDYSEILKLLSTDKKNLDGQLNIILLDSLGQAIVYPTTTEFFNTLLEEA